MVAVSANTGSEPLIGSKVNRDRASYRYVWSEKASLDSRSNAKSGANSVRSVSDRTLFAPDGVKRRLECYL